MKSNEYLKSKAITLLPMLSIGITFGLAGILFGRFIIPANTTGQPTPAVTSDKQSGINSTNKKTFIVFGDSGTASPEQKRLAARLETENPEAFFHTGDLVYNDGKPDEILQNYAAIYSEKIKKKFYPSPGNHDYNTNNAQPYLDFFDLPKQALNSADNERYYSVSFDTLHFIMLDSNLPLKDASDARQDDMIDWLRKDLTSNTSKKSIVIFHHPYYTGNSKHSPNELVKEKIIPVLDEFKVPLVLNGHNHNYMRSCKITQDQCAEQGVTYIVTGGGGADLYDFKEPAPFYSKVREKRYNYVRLTYSNNTIAGEAIDIDGTVFDTFSLQL